MGIASELRSRGIIGSPYERLRWLTGSCLLLALAGCGATAPAPKVAEPAPKATVAAAAPEVAPAEPEKERVLPKLATGSLSPELVEQPVTGSVKGYFKSADTETFLVETPMEAMDQGDSSLVAFQTDAVQGRVPYSFELSDWSGGNGGAHRIWLRRSIEKGTAALTRLSATVLTAHHFSDSGAHQYRVEVANLGTLHSDPKVGLKYLQDLSTHLGRNPLSAFLDAGTAPTDTSTLSAEWSSLMRLASGYDSVEAALRSRDHLAASSTAKDATIELSTLQTPHVDSHPWAQMLAGLPAVNAAPEPLADATPADFYFLRAKTFDALSALLQELDLWVTSGVRLSESSGHRYDLVERYRAQLGLSESELTRILGPKLVQGIAIVGSDPFVRQGSDVSVMIRPFDPQALLNALNAKLRIDYPSGVNEASFKVEGLDAILRTTSDGKLRQYLVQLPASSGGGGVTVVSNSKAALERIVAVALGKQPALSAELDFKYMLKRDADTPSDVLTYAGDRFVTQTVSPRQRVLDARRQLALAELSVPGYSALLFAWLEGREPKDVKELLGSSWLKNKPFAHSSGEKIQFELGQAPHSSWGSPEFLTPLIDLPTPQKVTPSERDAYQSFAQSYEWSWSEHVDPVAGRFQVVQKDGKRVLEANVRVLPIVENRDYREVWEMAGTQQIHAEIPIKGVQFAMGIGKDARLRQELSGAGRSVLGRRFSLDWLGTWGAIGLADEPEISELMLSFGEAPEPKPRSSHDGIEEHISEIPAYAVIEVKKAGIAALAIAAIRKSVESSAAELLRWEDSGTHHGVTVHRVSFDQVEVFYALTKQRLYLTLQESLMNKLIDADLDGTPLAASADGQKGGQLVGEMQVQNPSALLQTWSWIIEKELRRRINDDANQAAVTLRGLPGRSDSERERIARAYTGSTVVTPEGEAFKLGAHGVEDPRRGNVFFPVFGEIPAPGSDMQKVLEAMRSVHFDMAFDLEPGANNQRSLRAHISIPHDAP